MKKTIAILLILVIGMVGVFAGDDNTDTVSVKITTSITAQSVIGIVNIPLTAEVTTKPEFDSFLTSHQVTEPVPVSSYDSNSPDTIGHLAFFSNKTAGLTTKFKATLLEDVTSAPEEGGTAPTPVTTTIKYTVTVGGVSVVAASTESYSSDLELVAPAATGTTMGSKEITVYLDEATYTTAAVPNGSYQGTITFSYITN
jgi:hypothetical protein